ncbi:beta strand repeat-containing protein, partial [Tateyamaria sp.]|uniref:beta strand repeat-containing protein n=1 Tax=Tateyamaria sp. TaxID=1929288 RepID=UPI0032A121C8
TLTASGGTTNESGGALTIDAGAALASNTVNQSGGDLNVDGTLTGTLDNQSGGVTDITATGDVDGAVTNAGDLNVDGGSLTSLDNNAGGDADFDGAATVDTTITNAGALDVNTGTLTASGGTTNESGGALTIDAGAALASNTVNQSGGDLNVDGTLTGTLTNQTGGVTDITAMGDVDGAVTNAGDLNVDGGSLASLLNNVGGDVDFDGAATVDTTITNFAALDINSGTTTANSTTNNVGGIVTVDDGAVFASNLSNLGTTNLAGQITGNVSNANTLNVTDNAATIDGDLTTTAASEVNIEGAGSNLNVTGDASLNGNFTFDAALSGGATVIGNTTVGGDLSGNVALTLDAASGAGDFDNALLFSYTGTNTLSFSAFNNLPNQGALEYFVEDSGSTLLLRSRTSSAVSGVAATVGLTQTLVNTIVNRPTSPFVADLAAGAEEDPCGAGVWSRITGGTANANGNFTDNASNLSGTSPVSLNYSGLQVGGDFACFGGHYDGWDLAFGGIAGFNNANSTSNTFGITGALENVIDTDIFQRYAGVYATAARGRFFADLQYRYESTEFETSNSQTGTSGLSSFSDVEYDNTGQTLSGAVGYSWPLASEDSGLTFVSSAGFSYSRNETDDVTLGTDGNLTFSNGFSRVGFLSASVAKSKILPDEESLISYFGTATVYNDFADDRNAVFTPTGGVARSLSLENLGAYGEVSLGVNYLKLLSPGDAGNARQLNASVRVDARFSDDVESYGITGQFRLQF